MRKNSQRNPLTQEEIEQLWKEIYDHEQTMPKLDMDNIAAWSHKNFVDYRTWSHKAHELRRLFDLH